MQIDAFDTKLKGIADSLKASNAAAWGEIAAGLLGVAGSAASPFAKLGGEVSMHVAQGAAKLGEGIAKYGSAKIGTKAQTEEATATFQTNNAESYSKSVADLTEKARKASSDLESAVRQLVELHSRLSSAIRVN